MQRDNLLAEGSHEKRANGVGEMFYSIMHSGPEPACDLPGSIVDHQIRLSSVRQRADQRRSRRCEKRRSTRC